MKNSPGSKNEVLQDSKENQSEIILPFLNISTEVGTEFKDTILSHLNKFKFIEREFEVIENGTQLVKKYEFLHFDKSKPQHFHRVVLCL